MADTRLPTITIVTPSLNQAKYLPETIESVLNQGYPHLEYIIVDGGSTDGSVEIIKKYQRHLAYWASETDSGQSEAINKGFRKATGVLFNWINSDDLLFPGALRRIGEAFARNPTSGLIVGDHGCCDPAGRIIWVSAVSSRAAMSLAGWLMVMGQQSTFVSAEAFRRVGGVREDLHISMDMDLYYRLCRSGAKVLRAHGLVGVIRKHPEAKGSTSQALWRQEQTRLFQEYAINLDSRIRAIVAMRFRRMMDGSYLRSLALLHRWKGKRPWDLHPAQSRMTMRNRG